METPAKVLVIIDELEIKQAMKASDVLSLLFAYDNYLRSEYKYQGKKEAHEFREKLNEMMRDYNINLDELLQ